MPTLRGTCRCSAAWASARKSVLLLVAASPFLSVALAAGATRAVARSADCAKKGEDVRDKPILCKEKRRGHRPSCATKRKKRGEAAASATRAVARSAGCAKKGEDVRDKPILCKANRRGHRPSCAAKTKKRGQARSTSKERALHTQLATRAAVASVRQLSAKPVAEKRLGHLRWTLYRGGSKLAAQGPQLGTKRSFVSAL